MFIIIIIIIIIVIVIIIIICIDRRISLNLPKWTQSAARAESVLKPAANGRYFFSSSFLPFYSHFENIT